MKQIKKGLYILGVILGSVGLIFVGTFVAMILLMLFYGTCGTHRGGIVIPNGNFLSASKEAAKKSCHCIMCPWVCCGSWISRIRLGDCR